jgi:hypothetical protein
VTLDEKNGEPASSPTEKKFNLDGLQYYLHDFRRESEIYSTHQSGGGSVMVWAALCASGKSELVIWRELKQ